MHRLPSRFFLFALCAVGALQASSAIAAETGSMPASHMMFLGTWRCAVKFPAMDGQKAFSAVGMMTISQSGYGTIHSHVQGVGHGYASDSYEGYNKKTKTWWIAASDNTGGSSYESSSDHKAYTGTGLSPDGQVGIRDTRTMQGMHTMHLVGEEKLHGKWAPASDGVCTKQ